MTKLALNVADLRVTSFDTDDKPEPVSAITGTGCWTYPTRSDACCTL